MFHCIDCNKSYKTQASLKRHQKTKLHQKNENAALLRQCQEIIECTKSLAKITTTLMKKNKEAPLTNMLKQKQEKKIKLKKYIETEIKTPTNNPFYEDTEAMVDKKEHHVDILVYAALLTFKAPDFDNSDVLCNDRLNLHFKTLSDEDLEQIKKGPGWISIKFEFMEERSKLIKGVDVMKIYRGIGYGYANCSLDSVKYLFSLYLNQVIKHTDCFHHFTCDEFIETFTDFGERDYEKNMKIIEIKRYEEKPNLSLRDKLYAFLNQKDRKP